MAMLDQIRQKFYDAYYADLVLFSTSRYVPGGLLNARWNWSWPNFDKNYTVLDYFAQYWDFVDLDKPQIVTEDANLLIGQLKDSLSIGASFALPQIGLSVSADFSDTFSVDFEITGVSGIGFANTFLPWRVTREFEDAIKAGMFKDALKDKIDNAFLIAQSFFVSSAKITATASTGVSLKAAYDAGSVKLSAGINYKFDGDGTLVLPDVKPTVPLAVQGNRLVPWRDQ